jgi:competence protein ComFC
MYYILTTYFSDHWDKVRNNKTGYLKKFLALTQEQIVNDTPTIFLRINKASQIIEKAWVGKIYNIEITDDKINYSVHIDSEIELEPEFTRTRIGWYVIDEKLEINKEELNQEVHHELNVQELSGNWKKGWALDLHTLHSVRLREGSFDTKRTKIGEYLYQLKYCKNKPYASRIISLAEEFTGSPDFQNIVKDISVILPVPPSDTSRAFQPVYELTEELSRNTTTPVDYDYLKKLKSTSQIKSVENINERRNILRDSFDVTDERYKDKNVLLFDDLYRSGVTLEEITTVLKQKGKVKDVYVLTITKTRTKR